MIRFTRTFSSSVARLQSSCKAGTVLNLNIKKTGKDPIALEDSEYPGWLWSVLDKNTAVDASKLEVSEDTLKLRKKQIRQANREKIKQRNFLNQL